MLVIFLYIEVLLFSYQKVPCWACKGTEPTSYKNAQHQNQLRCWSTEAPVLLVTINVFALNHQNRQKKVLNHDENRHLTQQVPFLIEVTSSFRSGNDLRKVLSKVKKRQDQNKKQEFAHLDFVTEHIGNKSLYVSKE